MGPEKLRAAAGEPGLRNGWEAEIRADYANHNGKCKNCKVCYLLKLLDDYRALAAPVPAAPAQMENAMRCPQCGSEDYETATYFGDMEPETGYRDEGVQGRCSKCGLVADIEDFQPPAAQPDTAQLRSALGFLEKLALDVRDELSSYWCQELNVSVGMFRAALAAQPATARLPEWHEGYVQGRYDEAITQQTLRPATARPEKWMIVFDDPDRTPLFFEGPDARRVAAETHKKLCDSWTCELFLSAADLPATAPATRRVALIGDNSLRAAMQVELNRQGAPATSAEPLDSEELKRELIDYLVENDGQDSIECLVDGALWLVRAALRQPGAPATSAEPLEKLVREVAKDAVELALVRHSERWVDAEGVADDAVDALFGEGTCEDEPAESVQKLLAALRQPGTPAVNR